MRIKSFAAGQVARIIAARNKKWIYHPLEAQQKMFRYLVSKAAHTAFGKEHGFSSVKCYKDLKKSVPVRDYEQFKPYIDRVIAGEQNVLWPGKPLYLSKTSGTTSGIKYIPITKASMPYHINSARDALLNFVYKTGNSGFFDGKMIFLSGSPEMTKTGGILTGRLSGIVNHHVPAYLRGNQLPSYKTNCIEDWEQKVDKIVAETMNQDMTLISGIPPWVQMYFDRLTEVKKQSVAEIFPNLSLLVHGGVNFQPYKPTLLKSIGKEIETLETYPASEGFIAYQDVPDSLKEKDEDNGLLLLVNNGMFYEFIPAEEFFGENPTRLSIEDVEPGVNYVVILNTNAGLWGYNIGDTVKFISKNPYRIIVTGRIKHFISAFGEHVIGEEVDEALMKAAKDEGTDVIEFTVAPKISNGEDGSCHEWFVEFANEPEDIAKFALKVDENLQQKNIYYRDLVQGKILQPLKIRPMQKDAFRNYMRSKGKLGGQNKVPRLSNDRSIADELIPYVRQQNG